MFNINKIPKNKKEKNNLDKTTSDNEKYNNSGLREKISTFLNKIDLKKFEKELEDGKFNLKSQHTLVETLNKNYYDNSLSGVIKNEDDRKSDFLNLYESFIEITKQKPEEYAKFEREMASKYLDGEIPENIKTPSNINEAFERIGDYIHNDGISIEYGNNFGNTKIEDNLVMLSDESLKKFI